MLGKCCRLCLSKNGTLADYKSLDTDGISFIEKINSILSQLINQSFDYYPKWICFQCQKQLHNSYEFIQNCIKSQKMMDNYYQENLNPEMLHFNLVNKTIQDFNEKEVKVEFDSPDNNIILTNDESQKYLNSIDIVKHEMFLAKVKIEPEDGPTLSISEINIKTEIDPEFNMFEQASYNATKFDDKTICLDNDGSNMTSMSVLKTTTTDEKLLENLIILKPEEHLKQEMLACDTCNMEFNSYRNLNEHQVIHSNQLIVQTTKIGYSCNICSKKFNNSSNLYRHTRIHTGERPYSCDICSKKFLTSSQLVSHTRTHTGEKPYSCEICNKRFIESSKLSMHKRIHTGEKPYSCEICSKKFTNSSNLLRHTRIHTGKRPYSCNTCNMKFAQSSNLIKHKRTHTAEKPYSCKMCNKKFIEISQLDIHKKIHTEEKPYSCDMCEKKFTAPSKLVTHKRTHTGERPYSCDTCNKKFAKSSNLIRHKKTHFV